MAAHSVSPTSAMQTQKQKNLRKKHDVAAPKPVEEEVRNPGDDLPPIALVCTVLLCSGALLVFALRDFLTTGRNIGGTWDEAFLLFTKSTDWFTDRNGWKSTQGGFSAVMKATTDENNMGGFFVRKLAGASAVGVHLQKLVPMLVHYSESQWAMGHFRPLLAVGLFGNLAIAALYSSFMKELKNAGAEKLPMLIMAVLLMESLVFAFFLVQTRSSTGIAKAMPEGKTPASFTSNIVSRTVAIVTTAMSVIAIRDLFFPGYILGFIPRDDIYLEWTNALSHSPPEGSPEAFEYGLEAPFYIGDKFISQFAALHVLILSAYKFCTAFFIRFGSDGSGEIKSKIIWRTQALCGALILFTFRIFQPAAQSASLDLRWHLMMIAYETFILALYGYA